MADITMPAGFLGHGSPMNALDSNRYTETWRRFNPTSNPCGVKAPEGC